MQDTDDKVFNYGRVMCHFASLLIEFIDACREVDGKRVIRCWRLFLPHFYAARRTKYALEALNIQIQLKVLSPQLSHELTWSRLVNTYGGLGNNISCDLANEHINKHVKEIVANMGPNFSEEALKRAAGSVTYVDKISHMYDKNSSVPTNPSRHSTKSSGKDIELVVKTVLKCNILKQVPGRKHFNCKSSVSINPLKSLNWTGMLSWIKNKQAVVSKQNRAITPEGDISDAEPTDAELEFSD